MSLQAWLTYCVAITLVIASPGPAALLCLHHGARHGPVRTFATVLGGSLSSLVLMTLSAFGLAEVFAASPLAFDVVRALGLAYLLWLMATMTWRLRPSALRRAAPARPLHRLFRDGFLVGIGNPKDLLFFGALFPQFLDPQRPIGPQLGLLFVTWVVVDAAAMSAYAALGRGLARRC